MNTERAILAGGCFWGMQDLVRRQPGVVSTRVGYSGGEVPNATYRNHGNHAEAIEIIFDPAQTSFRTLLEFFFQIHDPTTKDRQGGDVGASYRSAIFYTSEAQKAVAEEAKAKAAAAAEVAKQQQAKAEDRVAARYFADMKAKGKTAAAPQMPAAVPPAPAAKAAMPAPAK